MGMRIEEQARRLEREREILKEEIAQRKRAEESISRQRLFLEGIIDGLSEGFAAVDHNGKQIVVNKRLCEMTGFQKEELIGCRPPFRYWAEEAIDDINYAFAQTLKGVQEDWELMFKKKSGDRFLALVSPVKLTDPDGNPIFVATVKDVTARRRAEEALKESEEKYRTLFEESNDAIFTADAHTGRILDANKAAERLLGRPRKEIIGIHQSQLHSPDKSQQSQKTFREHILARRGAHSESEVIRRDGSTIPVSISTSIMMLHGKKVAQGIFRDITERKRLEAEKLAVMSRVATSVGHDLRNPLAAISSALYILKLEELSAEGRRMVDLIERNIMHADRIIMNLMDFSTEQKLLLSEVDIHSLIQEVLSQIVVPEHVELAVISEAIPRVKADTEKLKRVLCNLCSNAVEAMPHGGKLTVTTTGANDFIKITIKDTGVGIPKQSLEKLFTPLLTTKAKGMGLGLVNAKKIIESHGGSIRVKSKEGKGTTVTVKLPVNPPTPKT